jgi:lipopolysaccharide-induced tumor necrosis factor-alpha factor
MSDTTQVPLQEAKEPIPAHPVPSTEEPRVDRSQQAATGPVPPQYAPLEARATPEAVPVAIGQPYMISIPGAFGEYPVACECPVCRRHVDRTEIHHENGALIWILCVILFIFTLFCFFIPFLIKKLKDVVHTCPHCHAVIGKYQRI